MQIWQLTKSFSRIFILRGNPQELPSSYWLLTFLSIVYIVTKSIVYLSFITLVNRWDPAEVLYLHYSGAGVIAFIWILVLFAMLRTTLLYYNMVARFVQTATAFVGIDCIFNILFLVWLGGVNLTNQPLGSHSVPGIALLLGFMLMLYWQFMIYIRLLVGTMGISILKAGVFALFYMLMQQNLSEWLLNTLLIVTKIQGAT